VFENPSIFIEVVIRADPENDCFRFLGMVDIGIYSQNYLEKTEIRRGVLKLVTNKF
jgi:hypothetical protein